MIKEKQPNKGKNGTNNSFENIGTPGSSNSESREESKKESEKGPEVKEETDDVEVPENPPVAHSSPLDEVKSSPVSAVAVGSIKDEGNTSAQSNPCQVSVKVSKADTTDSSTDASSFCNVSDPCENVLHLGMPSENIHEGVQPLPSNVVSKQPVTMEAQYMQQQSQIFVFSTALANKAAEAVYNGQYNSIIAYHCAQPRTKKYLEGTNQSNTGMPNQCNSNLTVDQNNAKNSLNSQCSIMNPHTNSLMSEGMMPSLSDLNQDIGLTPPQPLAGVKVPDENLTPQQRQHREEQLATLRKMQQILFPEALQSSEEGSHIEPPISEHVDLNKTANNQNEWHKLQMPFYDDPKTRKARNNGPPPSYQQATRSASVPIALQSPNPSSPNNATSNLSLPSPRTCSGINSPADKVTSRIPGPSPTLESPNPARNTSSNPPTPVSSHLSPKHKEKMNATNEFSPSSTVSAQNSQHSPAESMYCRSVSSMGQQKQPSAGGKEPNLMPVPSPQQIQYLNAFEGQELTLLTRSCCN
uniref:B-cell lymphoma 9 beta-catenin binding domain-containing protein n=1 Tax=Lygus hesperus TaxID=30085 RepID=A0A0A9Y5Q4_LYGHE